MSQKNKTARNRARIEGERARARLEVADRFAARVQMRLASEEDRTDGHDHPKAG